MPFRKKDGISNAVQIPTFLPHNVTIAVRVVCHAPSDTNIDTVLSNTNTIAIEKMDEKNLPDSYKLKIIQKE